MAKYGAECFFSLDPEDVINCDGIILPGAPPDVDPALYGEEKEPGCGTLIQDMERKEPHRYSPEYPEDLRYHPVINIRDSRFHLLFGEFGIINSMHHQAIKKLGEGLIAGQVWLSETLSQKEKDEWLRKIENEENCEFTGPCIIEGIVHKTLPIICVQWHPELMYKAPVSGAADYGKLFEYFAFLVKKMRSIS